MLQWGREVVRLPDNEQTNWRISSNIKRAVKLAATTVGGREKDTIERIMLLGLERLGEQEPTVRDVLKAARLP